MSSPRKVAIGYALSPKKEASFLQEELRSKARSRGVELIPINLNLPLTQQGPFDVILHKFLGSKWCRELEELEELNPDVIIVDRPEAIKRLHNRISMLQVVSKKHEYSSGCTVGIPVQLPVYEKETLVEKFAEIGLKFPVIAKPLVADGTAVSHLMWLVRNWKGLQKLAPPFLLQQFVNHGGVMFKIYVVGSHVKCVKRPSLPDVKEYDLDSNNDLESFSNISNLTRERRAATIDSNLESTELPPSDLQHEISADLRKSLGLRLFNFDLIQDQSSKNNFYIVDINYFPGFAKMPDYVNVLTDFFVGLMHERYGKSKEVKSIPENAMPQLVVI